MVKHYNLHATLGHNHLCFTIRLLCVCALEVMICVYFLLVLVCVYMCVHALKVILFALFIALIVAILLYAWTNTLCLTFIISFLVVHAFSPSVLHNKDCLYSPLGLWCSHPSFSDFNCDINFKANGHRSICK